MVRPQELSSRQVEIEDAAKYRVIFKYGTDLYNPLDNIPEILEEQPELYFTYIMSRPEYFYMAIKGMMKLDIDPFQGVILQELWNHKFPMLVGSRGMGKCVRNSLIVTNKGIVRLDDIVDSIPGRQNIDLSLYGEKDFNKIDYGWCNDKSETKIIKTRAGFELEGTLNHPLRVVRNNSIKWVEMSDILVGDTVVIQRTYPDWIHNNLDEDTAYMLGAFMGDGCWSEKSSILGFTNADEDCINAVNIGLLKYNNITLKKIKSKYQYSAGGLLVKRKFIKDYNLKEYNKNTFKSTPQCIWSASKSSIARYLQGFFDTDGGISGRGVQWSSKSKRLAQDTQFLLLLLGIVSILKIKFNKQYNKNYYTLNISGNSLRLFNKLIGFKIKYKAKKLEQICNKKCNDNIDIIPNELILNDMLAIRELARDTVYKTNKGYNYDVQSISPYKMKRYRPSYTNFIKQLLLMSKSESVIRSKEYLKLKEIEKANYFYDVVTEIKDDYNVTYDVHLVKDHSFITNGFISHNSFTLAMYALLRALFLPNRKILICSAGFRQSQIIFNYIETIIEGSPILKNMITYDGNISKQTSGWEMKVGSSSIKAIPLGDGSRIRGLRANDIYADEFDSIPLDVFETVVAGFAAVSGSPITNARRIVRERIAKKYGIEPIIKEESSISNQIVLSGTAGYSFRHFAKYHERYLKIIKSRGSVDKLEEIFKDDGVPKGFNYADFCVMRIPVDLIPEGYMDDSQIARAKATVHSGIYQMEYCAVFSSDSNGFYPRSIIEKCTVKSEEDFKIKDNIHAAEDMLFEPRLYGDPQKQYIMGIDPAMSSDNFAIVILEIHPDHRRVVYCWTTNEADYKSKIKNGLIENGTNYYAYCVRKIRDLCRDFNIIRIALDKDGGGRAIMEGMNDDKILKNDEIKMWPVFLANKVQDTDYHEGMHIIELINFSKEEYTSQSNHGMRKDMEERELVFPLFDPISLAEAEIGEVFNESNDEQKCMTEIEELKNELCTIVVTSTAVTGRERFDTPEIKIPGGKKGRMRKDRYSALLMANMSARTIANAINIEFNPSQGGFAQKRIPTNQPDPMNGTVSYNGPSWLSQQLSSLYD